MSELQLTADFGALLNANVLANFALCDLLLRLAETQRLYIPFFSNDPKDRHVLAATVRSKSEAIVTFNLKHFRAGLKN